jgi:hypothetical protein
MLPSQVVFFELVPLNAKRTRGSGFASSLNKMRHCDTPKTALYALHELAIKIRKSSFVLGGAFATKEQHDHIFDEIIRICDFISAMQAARTQQELLAVVNANADAMRRQKEMVFPIPKATAVASNVFGRLFIELPAAAAAAAAASHAVAPAAASAPKSRVEQLCILDFEF